jgi:hypothetical protein
MAIEVPISRDYVLAEGLQRNVEVEGPEWVDLFREEMARA